MAGRLVSYRKFRATQYVEREICLNTHAYDRACNVSYYKSRSTL